MANKMLVDAAHPEETRVVVVRGNRVEEFDFESANRQPLRGNIYLATVTRVEPSLQAAFVEYGGNRHGFLAFSEIHPDYYQIPVADRQALLRAEEEDHADEEEREQKRRPRRTRARAKTADGDSTVTKDPAAEGETAEGTDQDAADQENLETADDAAHDHEGHEAHESHDDHEEEASERKPAANGEEEDEGVEQLGQDDAMEEAERRPARRNIRAYKIQEVIKRRQVILVQVVKEERGNKGAALTTYLSLAGRYCVLMPNTARGGGISRKIANIQDRKRLKEVVGSLEVPRGMGVILRTAGASRTKVEVKRDFEYLLRVWETVRELTLASMAPTLVYEEGNLVKRAIRDLYNKDIDEVIVAGEEAYKEAKGFMKLLMPSHAKNVQPYRETAPLFTRYGVESQLDAMFSNTVTLKSGGYIVINQTEALVAIDVNSGKSTREHNIEDTAVKTNLEAAEEIARQLRLRDLAGLVVVDFIDMEENRNNRAVEKKFKDCLKDDRARIQVGRISHFGLLEMSRQRIRTGVLESSTEPCPTCNGLGMVRAVPSVALNVLRAIEDQLMRQQPHHLNVRLKGAVALYILNQKRVHLRELEERFGVNIVFEADGTLPFGQHCLIEKGERVLNAPPPPTSSIKVDTLEADDIDDEIVDEAEETETEAEETARPGEAVAGQNGEGGARRRRRRRGRRGGRDSNGNETAHDNGEVSASDANDSETDSDDEGVDAGAVAGETDEEKARRRRRGRRGGRRNRRGREGGEGQSTAQPMALNDGEVDNTEAVDAPPALSMVEAPETEAAVEAEAAAAPSDEDAPKPRRRRTAKAAATIEDAPVSEEATPAEAAPVKTPRKAPARKKAVSAESVAEETQAPANDAAPAPATASATGETSAEQPEENRRSSGWWRQRFFGG